MHELAFNKVPFWVQVHDIPTSFLTRKVAENLCEIVGDIQRSNGAVDEDGGSFFRVRVMLDITLSLCRGRVIALPSGEKRWIRFKYERLPSLCYWCGCLNHDDRDCELWVQSNGTLTLDQQQFGPFQRASPYKSSGKDVIYVPNYYEKKAIRLQAQSRDEGSSHNVVHIQLGTTTLANTEPTVAEKGEEELQTVEAVTEVIVQRSLGKETETVGAINDNYSMPKNKEVIMTNVRCNDSDFLSKKDEFDMVFN